VLGALNHINQVCVIIIDRCCHRDQKQEKSSVIFLGSLFVSNKKTRFRFRCILINCKTLMNPYLNETSITTTMEHNNLQHHRQRNTSRIRGDGVQPPKHKSGRTSSFALVLLALFSTAATFAFQPQHHASTTSKGLRPVTTEDVVTESSTLKRSSHYYALDYRDLSTKSSSRLSLSSVAVPSGNSFINDPSDYYSWLSSPPTAVVQSSEKANAYVPHKHQQPVSGLSHSEEYQRRKEEWAKRYTSLKGLRKAFGSNRNKFWGDLDPVTTRKLYKSLLPNALCELVLELGVEPEELAPLAYKARKAAKLYARERCHVPARIAANLYDGFRQWKRYGKFQPTGMSWEQLWDKYYHEQLEEASSHHHHHHHGGPHYHELNADDSLDLDDTVTEEEIVAQTCQKILEKACTTNEMIDHMVLGVKHPEKDSHDVRKHRNDLLLKRISRTLTRDVRKLIDPALVTKEDAEPHSKRSRPMTAQEYHALKLFALSRRQMEQDSAIAASKRSREMTGAR
jgi:hypothetical protein